LLKFFPLLFSSTLLLLVFFFTSDYNESRTIEFWFLDEINRILTFQWKHGTCVLSRWSPLPYKLSRGWNSCGRDCSF